MKDESENLFKVLILSNKIYNLKALGVSKIVRISKVGVDIHLQNTEKYVQQIVIHKTPLIL